MLRLEYILLPVISLNLKAMSQSVHISYVETLHQSSFTSNSVHVCLSMLLPPPKKKKKTFVTLFIHHFLSSWWWWMFILYLLHFHVRALYASIWWWWMFILSFIFHHSTYMHYMLLHCSRIVERCAILSVGGHLE